MKTIKANIIVYLSGHLGLFLSKKVDVFGSTYRNKYKYFGHSEMVREYLDHRAWHKK